MASLLVWVLLPTLQAPGRADRLPCTPPYSLVGVAILLGSARKVLTPLKATLPLPASRPTPTVPTMPGWLPGLSQAQSGCCAFFLLQKVGIWGHACFPLGSSQARFRKPLLRNLAPGASSLSCGPVSGNVCPLAASCLSCIDSWFEVNRSCPEHPAD